ncbi:MAG: hypothetical protein K6F53_10495 [Lachnospiraceae bacterium]|nr:hypothetical protein [Lachnospiraceae bacterium]
MTKRSKYSLDSLPNSQIAFLIDEWIHDEVYRKLLKRIYIDGISNEQAAEEMELSVTTVKNIIKLAFPLLYEHISEG